MWGFALAFLQSVVYWKLGYKACYILVWVLSPLPMGLLYIGTVHREFFHNWAILIGIFQLIANMSNTMFQVLVCQIAVDNFDKKHVGKIIGAYSSAIASGKLFYAGFYTLFFTTNLGGFFLWTGMLWAVAYGASFLLHYPQVDAPLLETSETESSECKTVKSGDKEVYEPECTLKEMVTSMYFHAMFWSTVLLYSACSTFINNLTSIANSFSFQNPVTLIYIFAVTMMFAQVSFGLFFDSFSNEIIGSLLNIMCYGLLITSMCFGLFWNENVALYVMSALVGLSVPAANPVPMAMLALRFGRRHYSVTKHSKAACVALFTMLWQIIVGRLYDKHLPAGQDGDIRCVGRECFHSSFVMLTCVSIVPAAVQTVICGVHLSGHVRRTHEHVSVSEH